MCLYMAQKTRALRTNTHAHIYTPVLLFALQNYSTPAHWFGRKVVRIT